MSNVFVIINEWIDIVGESSSEVVDSKFFESESEAWDALRIIAESYEIDLKPDMSDISMEDHAPGLQFEEYYIQELTKGN